MAEILMEHKKFNGPYPRRVREFLWIDTLCSCHDVSILRWSGLHHPYPSCWDENHDNLTRHLAQKHYSCHAWRFSKICTASKPIVDWHENENVCRCGQVSAEQDHPTKLINQRSKHLSQHRLTTVCTTTTIYASSCRQRYPELMTN